MTLISAPRTQLLEDLPQWLQSLQVTHVGIVPSLIEATMHAVARSDKDSANGKTEQAMRLAYIASGGEKMSDAVRVVIRIIILRLLIDLRYLINGLITQLSCWLISTGTYT